jgi:hypothetical protein
MTLEEDVKELVAWHRRVQKEDDEWKAKREATDRVITPLMVGITLGLVFLIGLAVGVLLTQ